MRMRPKILLRCVEDNEDLNLSISELKEQLDTPEEECFRIVQMAKQARNEEGQKIFETFRQGNEAEGVAVNPEGESHYEQTQGKSSRRERSAWCRR